MANLVIFDSKPTLVKPILIECLPGIGNVGKIAGDALAVSMNAVKFATIYSEYLPPQVVLDDESVISMACNELWYAKDGKGNDIVFLRGECQAVTGDGQFILSQEVMNILLEYDVSKIITLGGYGTGAMVDEPRVLGAVTDLKIKKEFLKYGVVFLPRDPQAGIVGASGVLLGLGKIYGVSSICLMGETSGYFMDHKSAMAVVKILMKSLKVKMDLKEFKEKSEQIDALTAKVKEIEGGNNKEDLGYIG